MSDDTAMKRWAEAQLTVGQILETEARRDAIHFAVAPVEASCDLWAGVHVGLDAYGRAARNIEPKIGIVDPFLQEDGYVRTGQRFWLFLYPNTITTLRHVWEHPAFSCEAPTYANESEAFLRKLAAQVWDRYEQPVTYEQLLEILGRAAKDGGYCFGTDDGAGPMWTAQQNGLWDHFKAVTGESGPRDGEAQFRCAC